MSTDKKILEVQGLSCASCANKVQTYINKQEGVENAEVNFANSTVKIVFEPQVIDLNHLAHGVHELGYELIVEEKGHDHHDHMHHASEDLSMLKKKTIIAFVFAIPVFVISMLFSAEEWARWLLFALCIPVLLYAGRQFYAIAWNQAKHGSANMDTLVALGTGAAFIFSLANTIFPQWLGQYDLRSDTYYDATALIIALILLGRFFEERAKHRTSSSIRKLIGLQSKTARVIRDGNEVELPIEEVVVGDQIRIRPGEKVPVDAKIIEGISTVDESMITGEPIPVEKENGDTIIGASINKDGSLLAEAIKVGKDTMLSHIIQQVQDAQGSKPPIQRLADKIAGVFVPIVIGIAIFTFAIWMLLGPEPPITYALLTSVAVLVIACPCALGLATPTAIMVGMGKAAERGILIKDAHSLELARKLDVVVMDKTGTLTQGKPSVDDIWWLDGEDHYNLESIIYTAENKSEHPLAEAIVRYFKKKSVSPKELDAFTNLPGRGVLFVFEGKDFFIGNQRLMKEKEVSLDPAQEFISKGQEEGATMVFVAMENKLQACIALRDQVKDTSEDAVQQLSRMGIEAHLLSGDQEAAVAQTAKTLGIKHYKSEVLPADKLSYIEELQAQGKCVAMVGDGINDSPALAKADVGIAMGSGTDIAIESAEMTLVKGDLKKIAQAIRISGQTVKTIRQNLFWAFFYNVIGIPIAAGILFPFDGFLLSPVIAGAAMAFSSVSVVSNSLRLRMKRID